MIKIKEIIRQKLSYQKSYRKISRNLNVSVATVSKYIEYAKRAGIRSWEEIESLTNEEVYEKLFGVCKSIKVKKHEGIDWEKTGKELKRKGVTLRLLWQEYKDQVGEDGIGYTQFCIHYKRYQKTGESGLVMRQVHKGGEKFYVDYAGTTIPYIDPINGQILKAQIFVGAVGGSSFTYCEATRSQNSHDWLTANKHMLEYCGGAPIEIVPDNLKAGVKKADRYDPELNPAYREFGLHYNIAIMPARAVHPKDKAMAEAAVYLVTTQVIAPLRNKQFYGLAALNKDIKERLKIINHKPFQKKGTSRAALFEEIDKPALQPLPKIPFEISDWKKAKVHMDYHVAYDDHYYSVPYVYCGKHVMICATQQVVAIYLDNERIAVHARCHAKYKHTTLGAHMPKAHQEQARWTPEEIIASAEKIGPNTSKLLANIIKSKDFPQQGTRAFLGILRLSEQYGKTRLEQACTKALSVGMTRQREISYMLKNNLENIPLETVAQPPPVHDNIRGPQYYQQITTELKEQQSC